MSRILCLDYGGKRTGVAVTDPLQIIASPLETIETDKLMSFLQKYLSSENVETLVIGQPTRHDGSPSHIESKILSFIENFQKLFPQIPIKRVNEMYTSKDAVRSLIDSGVPKMKRRDKKLVDMTAATLILQDYLNYHS
jgi:putative Holliday junction resolvase